MLRARRDWTLATLAQKANLSASYLSLIESDKRQLSLDGARGVAEALGVPFITLLALSLPADELKGMPEAARSKLLEALMILVEELGGPDPNLSA
jgi:transcriptional regulator with XRE-family HTH domain